MIIPKNFKSLVADYTQKDANEDFKLIKETIDAIYAKKKTNLDFKKLYDIVWKMTTHKFGGVLYEGTEKVVAEHLKSIGEALDRGNDNFLVSVNNEWEQLKKNASCIRDLLFYMDENYAKKEKKIPEIYTVIILAFRKQILSSYSKKIQKLMMQVIENERNGEGISDRKLVIGLTSMLLELDKTVDDKQNTAYISIFEDEFLKQSRIYFAKEAQTFFDSTTATIYLERVRNRLKEEQERTSACSSLGTPGKIQQVILDEFVEKYKEALVKKQGSGVLVMLQNNNLNDLKLVYEVLSLVKDALNPTIEMLKEFCLKEAKTIIDDPEKDKDPDLLVADTTLCRVKYEKMLNESFSKQIKPNENKKIQDPLFAKAIKDSFDEAINSHKRFSEYLSLLIDKKVKKGKDRVDEKDADEYFSKLLLVLKHLLDKDFFLEYYKKHLANRLLLSQTSTPDDENEKLLLTKLKQEYGYSFVSKLEGMLKDLKTSESLKDDWKKYQVIRVQKKENEKIPFELGVQVLTYGFWPFQPNNSLSLPLIISNSTKEFNNFWKSKFEGRRLMWMFNMGTGDLNANGYSLKYKLNVPSYMMGILLLFNDQEKFTFGELSELTKIPLDSLKSNLNTLTTPVDKEQPVSRVLNHNAKRDEKTKKLSFAKETEFTPNETFKNKSVAIKLGVQMKKESEEDQKETKKKVDQDRMQACQAAIVRIMKMRKTLDHKTLVIELRQQLNQYFQPDLRMISEAISFLIDSDYLKRDEDNSSKYIYVP